MADSTITKRCPQCAEKRIEHTYQDNQNGKYNRIFNLNPNNGKMTCTVCGYGKTKK